MQTYLVHMRHPWTLLRELGPLSFLAFQALMGGIVVSCLLHPLFYLWMGYEVWSGEFLDASGSAVEHGILALACFNLFAGIGSAMATAALTANGRTSKASHVVFMPFYWLLISWAAWRAAFQLVSVPHLWEKTEHNARRKRVRT